MPNILIRDVASDDHNTLRLVAESRGVTMQQFLADLVHRTAAAERNRQSIAEHGRLLATKYAGADVDVDALLAEGQRDADERTAYLMHIAGIEE